MNLLDIKSHSLLSSCSTTWLQPAGNCNADILMFWHFVAELCFLLLPQFRQPHVMGQAEENLDVGNISLHMRKNKTTKHCEIDRDSCHSGKKWLYKKVFSTLLNIFCQQCYIAENVHPKIKKLCIDNLNIVLNIMNKKHPYSHHLLDTVQNKMLKQISNMFYVFIIFSLFNSLWG